MCFKIQNVDLGQILSKIEFNWPLAGIMFFLLEAWTSPDDLAIGPYFSTSILSTIVNID